MTFHRIIKLTCLMCLSVLMGIMLGCNESTDHQTSEEKKDIDKEEPLAIINENAGAPSGNEGDCDAQTEGVNWDALMTENCPNLSDYNLFKDASDPTKSPQIGGVIYDLTTPLFTDYASKYRFVFIPEGAKAEYNTNEVFAFPIGTVLVKTFAMPSTTADRAGEEVVIETRLLIHREDGWVARPYYWEPEQGLTDAKLSIASKVYQATTEHKGNTLVFDYVVPSQASCLSCHAIQSVGQPKITLPIGPKARLLNKDYSYTAGSSSIQLDDEKTNQLTYWSDHGILSNLPAFAEIPTTPSYNDDSADSLEGLTYAEVEDAAKAYLDINCAHCHRSDLTLTEFKLPDGSYIPAGYRGAAGSTGVNLEYNRSFSDDKSKFGVCKTPVAGGHNSYPKDVVPGRSDLSYLNFRIETTDSRHKMPELGRVTTHIEGVQLVNAWVDQMEPDFCTP